MSLPHPFNAHQILGIERHEYVRQAAGIELTVQQLLDVIADQAQQMRELEASK